MDLHRLRVVGFDASVSEKERKNEYNAELENYEQEDWKTSTHRSNNEIGNVNQCLDGNKSPPRKLSKKCLSDKISPLEISKMYIGDTSRSLGTSVKVYLNDKLTTPGTSKICRPVASKKYLDDISITNPLRQWKNHSFTRRKSKSEIFKIAHKSKSKKHELKLNSSDTGLIEQFQDNVHSHQRKRMINLRKRNSRVRHKEENLTQRKEENDVHFLFTRETPNFMRFNRKRTENERTKSRKKRSSRLLSDIYGFQPNRSMDQHLYQMSCFKFIDTDKLHFKNMRMRYHRKPKPPQPKPVSKCCCKHHAMRVLKSAYRNFEKPSICYNLDTRRHPRRFQRNDDYDQGQEEGQKMECLHCMVKDEIVEVTPSALGPVSKGFCDARTGPSHEELVSSPVAQAPEIPEESPLPQTATAAAVATEYCQKPSLIPCSACFSKPVASCPCPVPLSFPESKKERKINKSKNSFVNNVCKGAFSRFVKRIVNVHSKRELSEKGFIKYVCVGLFMVVWSPCLLAGALAWVILFPVKFINLVKKTSKRSCSTNRFCGRDQRSEYQRMCFESYMPENKGSFMSSAARWYTNTVGTVVNSLKAVISVFKVKREAPMGWEGCSCLPPSSNPRKRYTLFYVENRGWVMKPLRRRKIRSLASSRVVQNMRCEFRPKMRRLNNRRQTSSKKAHYDSPVRRSNRYPSAPWDRSSPAGNVYHLQCTNRWLKSHGCKQVNIPSTFSNSTNKTLNFNNKKHNSRVITNYIEKEDLKRNHLGLLKNGTNHPLITNLETYKAHQYGLAGKTQKMSTKMSPRIVVPKSWTGYELSNAVNKAPGDDKITGLKDVTNSIHSKYIHSCKLDGLQRKTVNLVLASNWPLRRNRMSSLTNKKLRSRQKKLPSRNKSVFVALSKCALTKDANTSTHKISCAHKTQNTLKHIPYQKIINKCNKKENVNPDMVLKSTREAIHYPTTKSNKYKNNVPNQTNLSPVKIKSSIVLSSSVENKPSVAKRGDKHHQMPVAIQKPLNTTSTTICANQKKGLHHSCTHNQYKQVGKYKLHHIPATHKQSNTTPSITLHRPCRHNQSKQSDKHRSHHIPSTLKQSNNNSNTAMHRPCRHKLSKQGDKYTSETHKQSNTSDIMTKIKRNMALITPRGYKQSFKYQQRHIPVATQIQPETADDVTMTSRVISWDEPRGKTHEQKPWYSNAQVKLQLADKVTMTSRDVAMNCPSRKKYKQNYKYDQRQVPVVSQVKPQVADNVTMTSRDVALNCPSRKKHKQGYIYDQRRIPVVSQVNPQVADNVTMTSRDVALNCPSRKKYKQGYKYDQRQIPAVTQTQPQLTDNVTITSQDIALNCPSMEKHEQSKQVCTHESHLIPVATQMQPNTAETTKSTFCDSYVLDPPENKHAQYKQGYKYEPHQIPFATQMKQTKVDNMTMTSRHVALNYLGGIKPTTDKKDIDCIPRTADKNTSLSKLTHKYVPAHIPVATQMQSNIAHTTTMTNRDIDSNDFGYAKPSTANKEIVHIPRTVDKNTISTQDISCSSKRAHTYAPGQIPVATQKQSNTIDISTMTKVNTGLNNFCGHGQSTQASTNRDIALNYFGGVKPSTANKEVLCIPKIVEKDTIYLQKNDSKDFKIDESVYSAYESSKTKEMVPLEHKSSVFERRFQPKTNSSLFTTTSDYRYDLATKSTHISKLHVNSSKPKVEYERYVKSQQNKPDKKTDKTENTHNTQLKLRRVASCTSFDVVADGVYGTNQGRTKSQPGYPQKKSVPHPDVSEHSHKNIHETTTLTDTQGLISDPVPHSSRNKNMVRDTPTSTTDIQKLRCVCKRACKTVQPLNSEFPQHVPIAQPDIISKIDSLHRSLLKKQPSQSASIHTLGSGSKVQQDFHKVIKILTKSLQILEHLPYKISQATNTILGKAGDCRCHGTRQPSKLDKKMDQITTEGKTHKTSSAKELSSTKSKRRTGGPSVKPDIPKVNKALQATSPLFVKAADCRSNETPPQKESGKEMKQTAADSKKRYLNKISSTNERPSQQPKLTKAPPQTGTDQTIVVEKKLHNENADRKYQTTKERQTLKQSPKNSSKKFLKSSENTITSPKKITAKVNQGLTTLPKLLKCLPSSKYEIHKCHCPVDSMQNVQESTPLRSWVSMFNRKSKRKFLCSTYQCQSPSSYYDLDESRFESGIPVAQSTTRRRPEVIHSVDKAEKLQSQCSKKLQHSSISLVMNVRSSLLSRKLIKEGKVSEHSVLSSYSSKTYHTRHCPIDNPEKQPLRIRKSMLSDESSRLFRGSHSSHHKVKTWLSHVHQAYVRKSMLGDTSSSCLRSVSQTHHRPSYLAYLSKIYRYLYPRFSQRIISQQSKTSEHSLIAISKNKDECGIDDTSPTEEMSHQILKTPLSRNPHSKSQQLLSQLNRSQKMLSSQYNMNNNPRSSKKHGAHQRSENQSLFSQYFTLVPGIYRCAKEHLSKNKSCQFGSTSAQKQSSKNIQPQYSSFQYRQNMEPKRSSFNLPQSKPLINRIRSITDIISTKSRKNKSHIGTQTAPITPGKCDYWPEKLHQIPKKIPQYSRKYVEKRTLTQQPPSSQYIQPFKNSHQPKLGTEAHAVDPKHLSIQQHSQFSQSPKVEQPFTAQRIKADQSIPIFPGRSISVEEQKVKTESSINKLLFDTDFKKLPSKSDRILKIIPGSCRCAGERKINTEHSLSNKLQLNTGLQKLRSIQPHILPTDNHRFRSPTVSHAAHKASEFCQSQKPSAVSKLSKCHATQQTGVIHNAPSQHFQPTRKKPSKYRSFKYEHEKELLINNLYKIANTQSPGMLYHSSGKIQKSNLVSGAYTDTANKTRVMGQHVSTQRPEIPFSLKIPKKQPYPQILSNLQDQKPVPQIPTTLDKPPPELLQRYSAAHGRKCTAEGGVQQLYPDFNRASMCYPGLNGTRKQSNNVPPLLVCGPCTNPGNTSATQSPYDESALRRAYKRRPLRYTPPRDQLPNLCKIKNKKADGVTKKQMKKRTGVLGFCGCLRGALRAAEQEAWPNTLTCGPSPMWLNTLKRKPCFWIYKMCPRAYPSFLSICLWMNAIHRLFAYCLTICFWSPLFLCLYCCFNVLCTSS